MSTIKILLAALLLFSTVQSCHSQRQVEIGSHPDGSFDNLVFNSNTKVTLSQQAMPTQVDSAFIVVNYFIDSTLQVYGANLAMARLYSSGELWRSHTDPSIVPLQFGAYDPIFNILLEELVRKINLEVKFLESDNKVEPFIYGLPVKLPYTL